MNLQLYFSIVVEVIIHLQNLRLTESRLIINCEYKYFFRLSCLTAFLWWRGENHSSISRIVSLVKFHSSRQGGQSFSLITTTVTVSSCVFYELFFPIRRSLMFVSWFYRIYIRFRKLTNQRRLSVSLEITLNIYT